MPHASIEGLASNPWLQVLTGYILAKITRADPSSRPYNTIKNISISRLTMALRKVFALTHLFPPFLIFDGAGWPSGRSRSLTSNVWGRRAGRQQRLSRNGGIHIAFQSHPFCGYHGTRSMIFAPSIPSLSLSCRRIHRFH